MIENSVISNAKAPIANYKRIIGQDNKVTYFERQLTLNVEGLVKAAQLIDSGVFETYFLYEKEDEVALGVDFYTFIEATPKGIFVRTEGKTEKYSFEDLSETLTKVLDNLKVKDWRAYGIANYSLARFNYDLLMEPEGDNLLQLVIPKSEIRFYKNRILLRSLEESGIDEIEAMLKGQADESNVSIDERIKDNKVDCAEIYTVNEKHYKNMVAKAIEEIRAKQYEKVVLSRKITVPYKLDMPATFIAGRKENTPKRSYFFKLNDLEVVGFSPETVVEIDKNGWVSTLPLAGTRATGSSVNEKEKLRQILINDSKEIIEHISTSKFTYDEMKKVCDPKTVSIYDFLTVVDRGTVQHLASRVVGKKEASLTSWHVFNGIFPAATSSGTPKRTAIETIGRLEKSQRDLYGGCVLTYDYDGTLDSALVLRTVFKQKETAWLHVGAGIGPLCNPDFEFQETCDKISSVSRQLVCLDK